MIISDKQIDAMNLLRMEEYVQQLVDFYRDRAPLFVKRFSDTELKEKIAIAVLKARGWNLHSPEAIMQYVGLVLVAGPQLHKSPKVCAFLSRPGSSPELKLKRLLQLLHMKLVAVAGAKSK